MARTTSKNSEGTTRKKAAAPKKLKSFNPATGETMREITPSTPGEVQDAVEQARKVAPEWGAISPEGRVHMLREVRHRVYEMSDELVEVIAAETGKTAFEALALDVVPAVGILYGFERIAPRALRPVKSGPLSAPVLPKMLLGATSRIEWRPFGVVGCITPWNYPLYNTFLATLSPLFAGNSIVIKPSEVTPGVGEKLKDIFEPLPTGVVSVVQGGGDVGAALVDAPCDKISFIGSPTTGRKICAAAARHLTPVVMELGGIDSGIVLDDADVDFAAAGTVWSSFFNCGQTCSSLERIYVAESIADEFTERFVEKMSRLEQGNEVGSLTFKPQLGIVQRQVDEAIEKGARVLAGGPEAGKKNRGGTLWYAPTAIDNVTDEMSVQREESFGPVVTITRVSDDDDAVRRANEEGTNLTASVWSSDMRRAQEVASRVRAGVVSLNAHGIGAGATWAPWGGVGESGFGRLNGELGIREFTVPVHIMRPLSPKQKLPIWYPYDSSSESLLRGALTLLGARSARQRLQGAREIAKNFVGSVKSKL